MDFYCQFCGGKADIIAGPNNSYTYRCPLCGARRPCTKEGRLIKNKHWRSMNQLKAAEQCHEVLDKLYDNAQERQELYEYLAKELKVPLRYCHFSMLSNANMEKAYNILTEIRDGKRKWRKEWTI